MSRLLKSMLMPRWWQLLVLIAMRLAQLMFVVPFVLFFSGRASFSEAAIWFIGVVALQYVLLFVVNQIETMATKTKLQNLNEHSEQDSSTEGDVG
ncbi:hypothetical protein [Celeribacter arenosi]|uniref:Uncharacterized protein n=1 Tax=Celeribacter arenosi TaxID=792649 RepID=A0ABP7KEN6_9RHOB